MERRERMKGWRKGEEREKGGEERGKGRNWRGGEQEGKKRERKRDKGPQNLLINSKSVCVKSTVSHR